MNCVKNYIPRNFQIVIIFVLIYEILSKSPYERYVVESQNTLSYELDDQSRTEVILTMNSKLVKTFIGIWDHTKDRDNKNYRLSLIIKSMTCDPSFNVSLKIVGDRKTHKQLCYNFDHSINDFQDVMEVYDDEESFTIELIRTGSLDWDWNYSQLSEPQVNLVVSIYHEVPGDCQLCPDNNFCCDGTKHKCFSTRFYYDSHSSNSSNSRCIPNYSGYRGSSNLCDNHPHCGRYCNADESDEICNTKLGKDVKIKRLKVGNDEIDSGAGGDKSCSGYDCTAGEDQTVMSTTLIVVAVFVLISVVYALAMMNPFVRKYFGVPYTRRQNSPEQYGNNRTENREMDSHSVGSVFVYVNTMSITSVSRPENDLPPPYEELNTFGPKNTPSLSGSNNEDSDELPTFSEAIDFMNSNDFGGIESTTEQGIVNESFEGSRA